MNAAHDQYEEVRLEALLTTLAHASAEEIIAAVGEAIRKHAAGHPQNDDITMLCLKRIKL